MQIRLCSLCSCTMKQALGSPSVSALPAQVQGWFSEYPKAAPALPWLWALGKGGTVTPGRQRKTTAFASAFPWITIRRQELEMIESPEGSIWENCSAGHGANRAYIHKSFLKKNLKILHLWQTVPVPQSHLLHCKRYLWAKLLRKFFLKLLEASHNGSIQTVSLPGHSHAILGLFCLPEKILTCITITSSCFLCQWGLLTRLE